MTTTIRDRYGNRYSVRYARKPWRCTGFRHDVCERVVKPGRPYLRHVTFPSDQIYDRVVVMVECLGCARAEQRDGLPDEPEAAR